MPSCGRVAAGRRDGYEHCMEPSCYAALPVLLRLAAVGATMALAACGDRASAGRQPVAVFAAASLTAPFGEIERAFEVANPGFDVRLQLDGSQNLAFQIQQGAKADVFASADEANMRKVTAKGLVEGEPIVFATNGLAIAVAKGNPKGVRGIADLARQDLRVAICGKSVPIGGYARAALAKAQVDVSSVSDETSVKALVSKVRLREIDAAIAYVTDIFGDDLEAVVIAPEHNVRAAYPIATLVAAPQRVGANAFVAFVVGEEGRAILLRHGFAAP